jgi:hypothetical protein
VQVRRLGKTAGAAHQLLPPGPQLAGFALDVLHVLLAHPRLSGVDVPLGSSPPSRVLARDATRLQPRLPAGVTLNCFNPFQGSYCFETCATIPESHSQTRFQSLPGQLLL